MTLREELYRTASKVLGEEINEEWLMKRHYRVVDKYLEALCREEAKKGKFYVKSIEFVELPDGSTLNEIDIKGFAEWHHLDYYPIDKVSRRPSLGFSHII